MRTKTLLIAAAALAATIISSEAQTPVYSANIVGYMNIVSPAGFSIIANQLDTGNNVLTNLMPSPANGTIIYKFGAAGYQINNYFNGWGVNGTNTLNPGEGAFIFSPAAVTNTFVGNVLTGSLTNSLRSGFSLVGSISPQAGLVDTNLSLVPVNGTIVYTYNAGFQIANYFNGWTPPSIKAGQGFFVFNPVATNWVQNFNPQ
jgi:hypothetical protein